MDIGNLYSTPNPTPDQVKSTQEYAKALLYGSQQQPVHHWTQGVSNMVNALVGGTLDYNIAQGQRAEMKKQATQQQANVPNNNFPTGGAPPVPFSDSPSTGQKNVDDSSNDDARAKAVAGIETGGEKDPYHAHGPKITNPKSAYLGDEAHGKYQVMGKNIGPWTEEVLGRRMTPEEFDNDPQAQEAIFKAKFKDPRQWFGHGTSDGHITGDEYVRRYNTNLAKNGGQPSATPAMAFNGPSDFSQVPAVQAMKEAMSGVPPTNGPPIQVAGDPQVAAAKPPMPVPGAPQMINPAPGGQPMINPSLVQKPPAYTRQQLIDVMGNPWTSPAEKQRAYEMALQQNQPGFMPSPTGSGQVLINPNNPGQQQYFAAPPHFGTSKVGEIEGPEVGTFDQGGNYVVKTPRYEAPATIGPRSEAAPAATPTAAPIEAPSPAGVTAQNAPASPASPVKVASTDPTAGIPAIAAKATSVPDVNTIVPQTSQSALGKFAQAGAPPGTDPRKWQAWQQLQEAKNGFEAKKKMNDEEITLGMKGYDKFKDQVSQAQDLIPRIDGSLALLNDPRIHTGMASGLQDAWSRFKEAFLGEKGANAPNELFDKLAAGQVLGVMRSTLQGLGQVRLAEIKLLDKANASRYYGDSANRAVLEISRSGLEKVNQIGQMANDYVSGGDVTDPVTGQVLLRAGEGKRHGLDSDFNKLAQHWSEAQNKVLAEKYKNYEKLFDTGRDEAGNQLDERDSNGVPAHPKPGQEFPFKEGVHVFDGTDWVPKNDFKPKAPVSK